MGHATNAATLCDLVFYVGCYLVAASSAELLLGLHLHAVHVGLKILEIIACLQRSSSGWDPPGMGVDQRLDAVRVLGVE